MGKVVRLRATPATVPERAKSARLTKRIVEAIRPAHGRDVWRWDGELRGFAVRVLPSGIRVYTIKYRDAAGRSRKLALGRHGVLTAEQARDLARQHLAAVARGENPALDRRARRHAPTVAELCERYLNEHADVHKKPLSAAEDHRLIEQRIRPALGTMKANAVSSDDVLRLHHQLRATPFQANRIVALLSKMFNLAEAWKARPPYSNPCRAVKRYLEPKRERFFSAEELGRLGKALATAERERTAPPGALLAIRLLALTGCRRGDVLALRWEHVDLEAGVLRLADSKTGPRPVPLAEPARDLLRAADRKGPFVVSGRTPDKPLSAGTLEDVWKRIRKAAGLENGRLHDLKHTVGTYAGAAGLNAFAIRDLLGHRTLAMTNRYVERDANPLRRAAEQAIAPIARALAGKATEPET